MSLLNPIIITVVAALTIFISFNVIMGFVYLSFKCCEYILIYFLFVKPRGDHVCCFLKPVWYRIDLRSVSFVLEHGYLLIRVRVKKLIKHEFYRLTIYKQLLWCWEAGLTGVHPVEQFHYPAIYFFRKSAAAATAAVFRFEG